MDEVATWLEMCVLMHIGETFGCNDAMLLPSNDTGPTDHGTRHVAGGAPRDFDPAEG
ncbi:hypothetical protein [Sandarakinorhabdus sp. DWP1-3-1]|uniref:hypothetical protein n=1 Tax=Sandarakinorhabdus sp. DWP1-3-1 TaxID=2804627 RepID=UPI003CEA20B6